MAWLRRQKPEPSQTIRDVLEPKFIEGLAGRGAGFPVPAQHIVKLVLGLLDVLPVHFVVSRGERFSIRRVIERPIGRGIVFRPHICRCHVPHGEHAVQIEYALRDLIASAHKQVSIENIQKTVADFYKIKVADMYSKKRTRNLARPRQIAMALAKELTPLSLPEIGDSFGGRDHTTVLHACRKVAELREQDQNISRDYLVLLQTLTS